MAIRWAHAGVFLLLALFTLTQAEDWAFDNAPGIAMEYKVHIDAGKEDCYYQYVHPSATIYVNMQVRQLLTRPPSSPPQGRPDCSLHQ